MANDDVFDSLHTLPIDGHDGGVAVLLIRLPYVFIGELSFRAQDYASFHLVDLFLSGKNDAYKIEKFHVLWVDDTERLVQGMDDCVRGWKRVIIDNWRCGGDGYRQWFDTQASLETSETGPQRHFRG